MSDKATKIIEAVGVIVTSKQMQKAVLGTYSDGTTRNVPDAINGEIYSPKQKAEMDKKVKKKKKKMKKKHKSNNGRARLVL